MKVVTSKQMAAIESKSYEAGSLEEEFMEEAGRGIAAEIDRYVDDNFLERTVLLLCGKGNNGGDTYVAGCYLLENEFDVFAYQIGTPSGCSPLCIKNQQRFLNAGGQIFQMETGEELGFPTYGVVLDGLFGTGFHGTPKEPYATVIRHANRSQLPIISVDIPSGLDGSTGEVKGEVINAEETMFLGLPKTGFFLREGWNHAGRICYIDFGLPHEFIDESDADLELLMAEQLKLLLPPIPRNRHKYEAGVVVGLAGSKSMPGAAMLASEAALRGGAGLVRLLHPEGMNDALSASPYELIRMEYHKEDPDFVIEELNKADATFIGPGLGRSKKTREFLKKIIAKIEKPCVLDADALTIIAEEKIPFPKQAILTPHIGEMRRLLGTDEKEPITLEFLHTCQEYAEKHCVTLVLKGGPSFIFHPKETIAVNPTGDPGMATAGTGDVLTGLIASFLAEGLPRRHAASLGVYLHGLAGEHAAEDKTPYSVIASDIVQYFPEAFRFEE